MQDDSSILSRSILKIIIRTNSNEFSPSWSRSFRMSGSTGMFRFLSYSWFRITMRSRAWSRSWPFSAPWAMVY